MVPRTVIVIATVLVLCLSQVESFAGGAQRRIQKGAASAAESKTSLYAVKKAKKSSKAKDDVVNFKKAEFISAVAEKTGMTKADSELALSAVLSVISTVSRLMETHVIIDLH